jgi:hypothetical protein
MSALTGQRVKRSVGPTGQSHPEADRWGPRSGQVKRKRSSSVLGQKGLGRLSRPNKGSARLRGSARPAAQQAGSGLRPGYAQWAGSALTGRPTVLLSSLSLSDRAVPHVDIGRIWGGSAWIRCGSAGVRVRVCGRRGCVRTDAHEVLGDMP